VIGKRSLVKNLHANGSIHIPDSTVLVQVRLNKPKTMQESDKTSSESSPSAVVVNPDTQHTCPGLSALILIGADDALDAHYTHASATFLGKPWTSFQDQINMSIGELWPDESEIEPQKRCLRTAKMFPVVPAYKTVHTHAQNLHTCSVTDTSIITCLLDPVQHAADVARWKQSDRISLQEALAWSDTQSELMWTREVQDQRDAEWAEDVLLRRQTDACLMPVVRRSADLAYIAHKNSSCSTRQECVSHTRVFAVLEKCASECEYDAAARALMHMAEWITSYAREVWGTRSGPGRHADWSTALESLYAHGRAQGIQKLAEVRRKWLTPEASPLEYLRCARHYESAAQVLTRKAVESCACFIQRTSTERMPVGEWVSMKVPARIDLAGGWLDTPPVCYEVSGMVINGSIKVDGELPIGAKASRTADTLIRLQVEDGEDVTVTSLEDMLGCSNPSSPAALLKACVVVAGTRVL
jgi:fucokinase